MSETQAPALPQLVVEGRRSALRRFARRDWIGGTAGAILVLLLLLAVFGPAIAPYPPNEQELGARLMPPAWADGGMWSHLLGTDELGRDVFSRLIAAPRMDLSIGFLAAGLEALIGVTLGVLAGYKGGRIEKLIMWWSDIQMGFPGALIVILILLLFDPTVLTLTLAIGLNGWMIFARLMRNEARQIRDAPFMHAAQVTGARGHTILFRHILPHLRGGITAVYLMEVPRIIIVITALSFIGLGVQPPAVSWGMMIGETRELISVAYWLAVFPGLAIVIAVSSLYLFSLWAEPRIDPLRKRANEAAKARG
jgi:peptide/nickel transport system permease protein